MNEYGVLASGHGSYYRFNGPPIPLQSLRSAVRDAKRWHSIADTIGGDAMVVRVSTMKIVWPRRIAGQDARKFMKPVLRQNVAKLIFGILYGKT